MRQEVTRAGGIGKLRGILGNRMGSFSTIGRAGADVSEGLRDCRSGSARGGRARGYEVWGITLAVPWRYPGVSIEGISDAA